jgi:hypothetical protein
MKTLMGIVAAVFAVGISASLAMANPALLPKHEGYPMINDGSPVTGQPTANDPGQKNTGGVGALEKSADATDNHTVQSLKNPNNERLTASEGAGRLPKVQGPQIVIDPPVKSATKIGADRVIQ